MTTISNIEGYVTSFAEKMALTAEHEWTKAISAFVDHTKDGQADTDAIARLQKKGFTVLYPQAPATNQGAAA